MAIRCRCVLPCALLMGFLGMAALSRPTFANILVNGSFETWSGGDTTVSSQPDRVFNDGSLVVPGWNFAIGLSSDLYRDKNAAGAKSNYYDASDGDYLAGSGSFYTLHEAVAQTFSVVPNTYYLLTFDMAPGGLNYNGVWIENASISSAWQVDVTGALATPIGNVYPTNLADFDASGTTNPLVWTSKSVLFQSDAVGGLATVQFTAYGDLTHVFLDNVVINPVHVPEPSTLVLAILAAAGTGLMRRFRRCS